MWFNLSSIFISLIADRRVLFRAGESTAAERGNVETGASLYLMGKAQRRNHGLESDILRDPAHGNNPPATAIVFKCTARGQGALFPDASFFGQALKTE
jgi:hypothetical protein